MKKRLYRSLVLTSACVLTFSFSVIEGQAEMFQCSDGRGGLQFTNAPTGSDCKPFTTERRYVENPRRMYRFPVGVGRKKSSATYDRYIERIGNMYNVDPYLIKAVIRTESDFDHRAISKKGAQGLMQLMPGTAEDLQVDNPFNPGENIDGGVRYLRSLLDTFDGNLILSLAAYNAGPGLVKRTGGIPRIPETLDYVRKVLTHYRVYKRKGV